MSDKVWIGQNAMGLETAPAFAAYTGVTIWYDDENAYKAGGESGRVLEIDCPWATQEMADNILASISGYAYRPFEAAGAILDPAAELGDGVTVGGVYGLLAGIDTGFDALMASDISSPADEEVDHEYPYESPQERQMARKVTLGKDYFGVRISKASGLEISKTDTEGNKKSRMKLNSDLLAFYNDDGSEALYFDANVGKFRFAGDVAVTGGTLNINNNFVVDTEGNVTLNGSVNLSNGNITWGKYGPLKSQFSPDGTSDWSDAQRSTDVYRRDWDYEADDWGTAYRFVGKDGSSASVPSYIKRTYIDETEIRSPTITGNYIVALGSFQVGYGSADSFVGTGYMGYAEGLAADDRVTEGVALSNSVSLDDGDNYVIVTDGGVRLQAGSSNLYITDEVAHIIVGGTDLKITDSGVFINGSKI